jgi:solute:Na+ symporter, SSS family
LLPVRYAMIIGLTVLALLYYNQLNLKNPLGEYDFELILPGTINTFMPVGILGIVLTGLMGAFMGTFSGTLNAAQAYIVNDIYLKQINPEASNKKTISINYIVGVAVVIIGILLGFMANSVNNILQWIVGGLYGGYVAANCLKWYWWRFNANGFFWGMAAGIIAALLMPYFTVGLPLYWWPLLFITSLTASVLGTFLAPPTDAEVLKSFYKTVRPWGFWQPIHDLVLAEDPNFQANKGFKLDMFNVFLGVIAQLCLTALPMYFVLGMNMPLLIVIGIMVVIIVILKRTWWDKLED